MIIRFWTVKLPLGFGNCVNVHFHERFVFEVRIVSVIRCKNVDELLLLDLIIPVDCNTNSYSDEQCCQNN